MPEHITMKFLETDDKESLESSRREMACHLQARTKSSDSGHLIGSHGGPEECQWGEEETGCHGLCLGEADLQEGPGHSQTKAHTKKVSLKTCF